MDKETSEIRHKADLLFDLTQHEGWGIAREKLIESITDLQNAFNIETESADKMLINLQARKMSASILYDWLKQIEGTAQQSKTEFASVRGHI